MWRTLNAIFPPDTEAGPGPDAVERALEVCRGAAGAAGPALGTRVVSAAEDLMQLL